MQQAQIDVWILMSFAAYPMISPNDHARGAQGLKCCSWPRKERLPVHIKQQNTNIVIKITAKYFKPEFPKLRFVMTTQGVHNDRMSNIYIVKYVHCYR